LSGFKLRRTVATSDHIAARLARRAYWGVRRFTLPAPRIVIVPILWVFLMVRATYYFLVRVFLCEPLFKAYCKEYGRGVRTDVYIHWIMGKGDIIIGDDVCVDGKSSFAFSPRFAERPTLRIGSHTQVGGGCTIAVAKQVTIGRHCLLAGGIWIADSNGHSTDPAARLAGLPPRPEEIRPVTIGDNVWIGSNAMILPGVTVGDGSVIAAHSVVRSDVPPYSIVAGNPAVKVKDLARPSVAAHTEPVPA
jgi:carbonic anhydrase/acetyltransferase-like protein (isoleucine patch superfamily)